MEKSQKQTISSRNYNRRRLHRWSNATWKYTCPNQIPLHSREQTTAGIFLHVNANKTEFMCFKREGAISALSDRSLKLVDKFTYLGSSVSSTESDVDIRLPKSWSDIHHIDVWFIWKNKTGFLLSWRCVNTTVWMNYIDAKKTLGEKARLELLKNTMSYFEQILKAIPNKTTVVRLLTPISKTSK